MPAWVLAAWVVAWAACTSALRLQSMYGGGFPREAASSLSTRAAIGLDRAALCTLYC